MRNPFKQIIHREELPDVIKKKVMDDLELIKLTIDFADLFAIKYPESINDLLKTTQKNSK